MTTIGLIGDSHAKVVFRTMKKILPDVGFDPVYIRAENGWGLKKHISQGTLDQLKAAKPKVIVASLGGNNHNLDADRYKKTIDQLLNLAKSMGSKVVWVGPTTSSTTKAASTERRHAWTHNFLQKYLPSKGIDYVNIRDFTKTGQRGDGVHYKSSFYKKWAQLVTKKLGSLKGKLESGPYRTPLIVGGVITLTTLLTAAVVTIARKRGSQFRLPMTGGSRPNKHKQAALIAKHLDSLIDKYERDPHYYYRPRRIPLTGEKVYKSNFNLPHSILDISNQPLPPGITSTGQSDKANGININPFNWQFAAPLNWGTERYYLLDKSSGIVYVVPSKHGYAYMRSGGGDVYEDAWWPALTPQHKPFFAPVFDSKSIEGYKVYTMPYVAPTKTNFDFYKALGGDEDGEWALGSILTYNGQPTAAGLLNGKPVISLYGSSPYQLQSYKEQKK